MLYVSDGYGSGRRSNSTFFVKKNRMESEKEKEKEKEEINNGSNKIPTTTSDTGFCDTISTQYTEFYNKKLLFWPCPKMKVSFNRLLYFLLCYLIKKMCYLIRFYNVGEFFWCNDILILRHRFVFGANESAKLFFTVF